MKGDGWCQGGCGGGGGCSTWFWPGAVARVLMI